MKRKILMVFSICLFFVLWTISPLLAQMGVPDIDTQVAELTKSLKLTKDQVPKVRLIIKVNREERQKRFEKARAEGLRDREKIMKMTQEGQKSLEDKLATVLTKEQLKTYKKKEEIRRANARSRMGQGMGQGMGMGR